MHHYRFRRPGGRLFWFVLGAGAAYIATHEHHEDKRELKALRARYEAERASQPAAAANTWGSWRSAEYSSLPASGSRAREEATDTALEVAEATLRSISKTVEELRHNLEQKKKERATSTSGASEAPATKTKTLMMVSSSLGTTLPSLDMLLIIHIVLYLQIVTVITNHHVCKRLPFGTYKHNATCSSQ
ncbi:hypothetical protein EXIGLDRAFT_745549, partial [Exidia glandulosa HHB12029]